MQYVISYDAGTGSVKAALVTTDGRLSAYCSEGYPLIAPQPGWAEQDPQAYWTAVTRATRRVLSDAGCRREDVVGVAVCTQWKGIIPIDAQGNVLHNSLLWLDSRAEEEAALLNQALQTDVFTGQSYWARLMWLRRHCPEVWSKTAWVLEANAYLKWKLTGQMAMDISSDFVHSYDPEVDAYYEAILAAAGIDRRLFPPLTESTAPVGAVTARAASETGLPAGIPVFSGCGDIPAATIGTGMVKPGQVHAYFGTSGWIAAVVDHHRRNLDRPSSGFTRERDIVLFGMQSTGLALDWAVRQFYRQEREQLGQGIYELLERELAEIPAGSGGVLATPWMAGELPPLSESARFALLGASASHDRRHCVNAVMEGVCYSMALRLAWCEAYLQRPVPELTVIGGGANSGHWMQTLADVLERPVLVPEANQHAVVVGAACCALVGMGYFSGLDELEGRTPVARRFLPSPSPEHRRNCQVFARLYPALEPIFKGLQA